MYDMEHMLHRQAAFSRATFGPGERTEGVLDHIIKEIEEVRKADKKSEEWVDLVILSLDGLLRALQKEHPGIDLGTIAYCAEGEYRRKLSKNELRDWPDWRTADPNKAIEHVKGVHD